MLKFAKGTIATLELSRHSSYVYDQRAEAFGANGCKVRIEGYFLDELEWKWMVH